MRVLRFFCIALVGSIALFGGGTISGQSTEILSNLDVVQMVESGLPASLTIRKIKTNPNRFDLSTPALLELSKKGVPEDVITAMMEATGNTVSEHHELTMSLENPGIYYLKNGDPGGPHDFLEPSMIDKVKEGNFGSHMAGALTAAAKKKSQAIIAGATANQHVDNNAKFLFYFGDGTAEPAPQQTANPNDPAAMISALQSLSRGVRLDFSSIRSPNEIRLVRTKTGKSERSFVASASSGMTREVGIDTDYVVDFKFDRLADGLYIVYPARILEPGEYLFVFAGGTISQGHYVYDFSVR
jgi:hypothetical protein